MHTEVTHESNRSHQSPCSRGMLLPTNAHRFAEKGRDLGSYALQLFLLVSQPRLAAYALTRAVAPCLVIGDGCRYAHISRDLQVVFGTIGVLV